MPTFFDAPTGAAEPRMDNLVAGTPGYEQAIFERTASTLKPQYEGAQEALGQQFANRGLLDSGLYGQADIGMKQAYLGELGRVASGASLAGADVREQQRRIQQARDWQLSDREVAFQRLDEQQRKAEEAANQAMWADMIGGTAGAVGTYFGGPVLGGLAYQGVSGGLKSQIDQPEEYNYSPSYQPPSLEGYASDDLSQYGQMDWGY